MSRAYNFSAGPAALPESVLRQARHDMLEWGDAGASIVELSHRGPEFMQVAAQAEGDLRQLLSVPDSHAVLFLAGGATTQQALVPLNFAAEGQVADYVVSGHWGLTALRQLPPQVRAHVAASSEAGGFRDIPPRDQWQLTPGAAYVHVTANETIHGVEYRPAWGDPAPDTAGVPLVADFSSSIASEPIGIDRYDVIYAGAQKNLGPVGVTIVIVRQSLLDRAGIPRADIFSYASHLKGESMLNTPPTWNWYMAGLMFRWMLDEGGVEEFARRSAAKSALLYEAIDGSGGFYGNPVAAAVRSRMNVPFFLAEGAYDDIFLAGAREAGLIGLKGHRVLGGMRASLYNAMPIAGVRALVDYMQAFQRRHG